MYLRTVQIRHPRFLQRQRMAFVSHFCLRATSDLVANVHGRYLAFIPSAPSEYANLFDLVVGASALYGGSWLEGAGAVFAENQALKWISDLANMPSTAGGVFAQGGTVGNLSALVTARNTFRVLWWLHCFEHGQNPGWNEELERQPVSNTCC